MGGYVTISEVLKVYVRLVVSKDTLISALSKLQSVVKALVSLLCAEHDTIYTLFLQIVGFVTISLDI